MKVLSGRDADEVHEFYNKQNPGKPKVALVKRSSWTRYDV